MPPTLLWKCVIFYIFPWLLAITGNHYPSRSCQKQSSPLSSVINECGTLFIRSEDTLFAQVPESKPENHNMAQWQIFSFSTKPKIGQTRIDRVTFCQFNTFWHFYNAVSFGKLCQYGTKSHKQVSREFQGLSPDPANRRPLLFALMSKCNKNGPTKRKQTLQLFRPADCNCCPTTRNANTHTKDPAPRTMTILYLRGVTDPREQEISFECTMEKWLFMFSLGLWSCS